MACFIINTSEPNPCPVVLLLTTSVEWTWNETKIMHTQVYFSYLFKHKTFWLVGLPHCANLKEVFYKMMLATLPQWDYLEKQYQVTMSTFTMLPFCFTKNRFVQNPRSDLERSFWRFSSFMTSRLVFLLSQPLLMPAGWKGYRDVLSCCLMLMLFCSYFTRSRTFTWFIVCVQ